MHKDVILSAEHVSRKQRPHIAAGQVLYRAMIQHSAKSPCSEFWPEPHYRSEPVTATESVATVRETRVLSNGLKSADSSLLEALREATRTRHAMLGACTAMARIFEPSYTIAEYRVHLGRLLGLFEPLERAARDAADAADAFHCIQRSIALREDLEIMGDTSAEVEALERCSWIPAMTKAGLPGYNYVIIGSMLGGKTIATHLRSVLGPRASLRFYGNENGCSAALWASFRLELESTPTEDKDTICATAMNVFDVYEKWLSSPMLTIRGS